MAILEITGQDLTLEQVYQVAYPSDKPIEIRLSSNARQQVVQSRQVIETVLHSGETVYGVNTGFGALSQVRIPSDDLDQLQLNFVRSHAAGSGPLLDETAVRAMILLRANTLAKGYSGVRPDVIDALLALLNHGICPAIPSQGSLGASGDLAPLAHLALVLIGEGEVLDPSTLTKRIPSSDALAQAGLQPLVLKAKEGLGLLNGTQMMTAIGILTLIQAEALLHLAEVAGTMTIEAIKGSLQPFLDEVSQVRPHAGQIRSAAIARKLLANSDIMASHRGCAKVQDPYSLRCIPQVHGAVLDVLAYVRRVLSIEANAATDNPLVFPDGQIVSQGNFHGEPVAMALDMLGIALTELASIAERRIDKLMNPVFSELPPFLVGMPSGEGLHSGLMIVHYTAASLVSENKVLAHPACVDSIPTSNDKEDHVSMGALSARKAAQILKHVRWVLAAELLCAAQGLEHRNGLKPGDGVWAAYKAIRNAVPPLKADRSCAQDVEAIATLMDNGSILSTVISAVGPLEEPNP